MKRRAAFFDRDGVVNITPGSGYVHRWEDFEFTPEIIDVIRVCRNRDFVPILVTNQRGVFTGETKDLSHIHDRMQEALRRQGAHFEAIYAAIGDRDDTRRKPAPAMFFEAEAELEIDLASSFMVGDNGKDILAAKAAGLEYAIQLLVSKPPAVEADFQVTDVAALHSLIVRITGSASALTS